MKKHGNSNENDADHHLYEIRDTEDEDVYKYGICGKPLLPDGSSSRANEQVDVFNRVVKEVARFIVNILLVGIPGRKRAKEIEQEYIDKYERKFGKKPRGNP